MEEDYPLYEQIALIYYHEHKYPASIHFFLWCVQIQPKNSMAWYGLGDSTCAFGIKEKSDEIYDLGISFIRKSISIDDTNQYSLSMLARMFQAPHIGKERIEKIATFNTSDLGIIKEKYMLEQEVLNLSFKKCSDDNRIRLSILLCDIGDFFSFELLNDAVVNDTEKHLRLAIMKRLATYCTRTQLEQTFEYLSLEERWKSYEPYFSKTLHEIGSLLTQLNSPDCPNWTQKVFNRILGKASVEESGIENQSNIEAHMTMIEEFEQIINTVNEQRQNRATTIKPWWKFW